MTAGFSLLPAASCRGVLLPVVRELRDTRPGKFHVVGDQPMRIASIATLLVCAEVVSYGAFLLMRHVFTLPCPPSDW